MQNMIDQGYIVQGLTPNAHTSTLKDYFGIEYGYSWPLDDYSDDKSLHMINEANEKWFIYLDNLGTVPESEYIHRYVHHCNELNVRTRIIKIEAPYQISFNPTKMKIKETLGYDCIGGINLSYLNLDRDYFKRNFPYEFSQLNHNGLFDSLNLAMSFIEQYKSLVYTGENIEYGNIIIPARISII